MSTLQEQARALGDPTRYAIFRYVVDAGLPVDVAELTAHFGVNHNAVRQHLAKLVAADLVTESTAKRTGPGRPRLLYEVDLTAEGRWGIVGPYERLSLLLAEVTRTGDAPTVVGERASDHYRPRQATGAEGVPTADDAVAHLVATMARLGFEPMAHRRGASVEIVLGTCPFASAAVVDADTVCGLHLGLARGLAEGSDVVVDELVVNDPRRALCRLRLRVGGDTQRVPPDHHGGTPE